MAVFPYLLQTKLRRLSKQEIVLLINKKKQVPLLQGLGPRKTVGLTLPHQPPPNPSAAPVLRGRRGEKGRDTLSEAPPETAVRPVEESPSLTIPLPSLAPVVDT